MQSADGVVVPGRQGVGHQNADHRNDRRIKHRARAHDAVDRLFALLPALDIDIGVIGDETGGPPDLFHHRVAGVDAQAALDAAHIGTTADIDAGRANMHALLTIDAVAGRKTFRVQRRCFLH